LGILPVTAWVRSQSLAAMSLQVKHAIIVKLRVVKDVKLLKPLVVFVVREVNTDTTQIWQTHRTVQVVDSWVKDVQLSNGMVAEPLPEIVAWQEMLLIERVGSFLRLGLVHDHRAFVS